MTAPSSGGTSSAPRSAEDPARADPSVWGRRTRAGWSFVEDAPSIGTMPAAAGFMVEVPVGLSGPRLGGRLAPMRLLAEQIMACRPDARQPVAVVARGVVPTGPAAEILFGGLADALGVPVMGADADVSMHAPGILVTTGRFLRWHPRTPNGGRPLPARRVDVLGPRLPQPAAPARVATPARVAAAAGAGRSRVAATPPASATAHLPAPRPAPAPTPTPNPTPLDGDVSALLSPDRWQERLPSTLPGGLFAPAEPPMPLAAVLQQPSQSALSADHPPAAADLTAAEDQSAARAGPTQRAAVSSAAPLWIDGAELPAGDRAALRRVLNGRYDAHARVVARTLAEEPGLRSTHGTPADLVAGLVALRAYCTEEREVINQMLRSGGGSMADERVAVLARCAAYGLRQLPAVFGPVFLATATAPGLAVDYQPGDELIEPGFVDVDTVPQAPQEPAVEIAIWSVSARRLDSLGGDRSALFPPGSRFAVLALDDTPDNAANGNGLTRVLLRELDRTRPGKAAGVSTGMATVGQEPAERIIARLREASRADARRAQRARRARRTSLPLEFAPGLDGAGRRFASPTGLVEPPQRVNEQKGGRT